MPRGLLCLAILLTQLGLLTHPTHAATNSNITIPAGGRVTVELEFSESVWSNTLSIISPNVAVTQKRCVNLVAWSKVQLFFKLAQHGVSWMFVYLNMSSSR